MPVGSYVYRAITDETWVKNGQPKSPAFRRRYHTKDNGEPRDIWDELGLSFGLSTGEACQGLTEYYGVAKLSVDKMRARGFEFNEPAEGHVDVTNMPFYRREERSLANAKAYALIECVEEFIPPEAIH